MNAIARMMDISSVELQTSRIEVDQAGDETTRFARLVERHSRFVFRVAYAILRNAGDSEDVAQETFQIGRASCRERV